MLTEENGPTKPAGVLDNAGNPSLSTETSTSHPRGGNSGNYYNIYQTRSSSMTRQSSRELIRLLETEVKNEVQDCPENDSVPGGELYIDENAEEKDSTYYPDALEKTDYSTLYGTNQYYPRFELDTCTKKRIYCIINIAMKISYYTILDI